MHRKPWPILVGIILVLVLAAAAFLGRPRPAALPALSPTLISFFTYMQRKAVAQ